MSEQATVGKDKRKRKWAYNATKVTLSPTDANELRGYYDEYAMHCQQSHHIPPKFRYFVIEMAKVGFIDWKEKVNGKRA